MLFYAVALYIVIGIIVAMFLMRDSEEDYTYALIGEQIIGIVVMVAFWPMVVLYYMMTSGQGNK